jgi:hypothetical protein
MTNIDVTFTFEAVKVDGSNHSKLSHTWYNQPKEFHRGLQNALLKLGIGMNENYESIAAAVDSGKVPDILKK